jgi:hypothetical protein
MWVAESGNDTDFPQYGLIIALSVGIQPGYLQGYPYPLDRITRFPHFTVPPLSKALLQTELAQAHIPSQLLEIPLW